MENSFEEILYDHYTKAVTEAKEKEKDRNKLFIINIVIVIILSLSFVKPDGVYNTLADLLLNKLNIGLYFGNSIIQFIFVVSLLYYITRYIQVNISIDRNYKYIKKLEDNMNKSFKIPLNKEGENYLNGYPMILNMIYYSYRYVFPVLYVLFILYKIYLDIFSFSNVYVFILNLIIELYIILINIFYIIYNYKYNN